jgi:hypothetical protein
MNFSRRKFLMTVGVLPFLSPRLFANVSAATNADYVLFGLGDPGYQVANAVQQLGFKGRVTGIHMGKAGDKIIGLTERLLNGESISEDKIAHARFFRPEAMLAKYNKQGKVMTVFIACLGGVRSTYLSVLAHRQLANAGVPFRMFLTTPFAYEGLLRNTRAQRFKIAFEGDQRINYINLNDCPRDIWPTVSDGFNKYPAIKIYQILRSVNYF